MLLKTSLAETEESTKRPLTDTNNLIIDTLESVIKFECIFMLSV